MRSYLSSVYSVLYSATIHYTLYGVFRRRRDHFVRSFSKMERKKRQLEEKKKAHKWTIFHHWKLLIKFSSSSSSSLWKSHVLPVLVLLPVLLLKHWVFPNVFVFCSCAIQWSLIYIYGWVKSDSKKWHRNSKKKQFHDVCSEHNLLVHQKNRFWAGFYRNYGIVL